MGLRCLIWHLSNLVSPHIQHMQSNEKIQNELSIALAAHHLR